MTPTPAFNTLEGLLADPTLSTDLRNKCARLNYSELFKHNMSKQSKLPLAETLIRIAHSEKGPFLATNAELLLNTILDRSFFRHLLWREHSVPRTRYRTLNVAPVCEPEKSKNIPLENFLQWAVSERVLLEHHMEGLLDFLEYHMPGELGISYLQRLCEDLFGFKRRSRQMNQAFHNCCVTFLASNPSPATLVTLLGCAVLLGASKTTLEIASQYLPRLSSELKKDDVTAARIKKILLSAIILRDYKAAQYLSNFLIESEKPLENLALYADYLLHASEKSPSLVGIKEAENTFLNLLRLSTNGCFISQAINSKIFSLKARGFWSGPQFLLSACQAHLSKVAERIFDTMAEKNCLSALTQITSKEWAMLFQCSSFLQRPESYSLIQKLSSNHFLPEFMATISLDASHNLLDSYVMASYYYLARYNLPIAQAVRENFYKNNITSLGIERLGVQLIPMETLTVLFENYTPLQSGVLKNALMTTCLQEGYRAASNRAFSMNIAMVADLFFSQDDFEEIHTYRPSIKEFRMFSQIYKHGFRANAIAFLLHKTTPGMSIVQQYFLTETSQESHMPFIYMPPNLVAKYDALLSGQQPHHGAIMFTKNSGHTNRLPEHGNTPAWLTTKKSPFFR